MEDVMTSDHAPAHEGDAHHGAHHAHAVPLWLLAAVFGALIVLTFVTVAVSWIDLGAFNIWLAMGIASLKATVVCLFFMHLYWDRPIHSFILVISIFFVFLLIGFVLMDAFAYRPDVATFVTANE